MTSLSSTKPKHVVYKSWAGFLLKGERRWSSLTVNKNNHLDKATWLTSAVEVGSLVGTAQSYDGCGMSAGIEHQIAVLPQSMRQGGLWHLLTKIEEASEPNMPQSVTKLFSKIHLAGWYLDPRGVLRNNVTGAEVAGAEIRNEFTPNNGVVPTTGPAYDKALEWIEVWSDVFSDPRTFPTQIKQAKLGLLSLHKSVESEVYLKYCNIKDASVATLGRNISPELDVAMCFYHSFSVNAPSRARQVLVDVLSKNITSDKVFAKDLVKSLGTNTYASWKTRYTRTWTAAKNSNLFDSSLFLPQGIVPPVL